MKINTLYINNIMDSIVSTENEQFKEKYPEIMKKVSKKKLSSMEPTMEENNKITNIIIDFITETKRKPYGGFSLNKVLIAKDPSLAIYDEFDTFDIEFYSPNPVEDLIKICDELYSRGYSNVVGQEAQHKETYSIFVNNQQYCDISYMPANIYNKTRFIQLDGINLIHPWFMMIDFFRMFTDPMTSFWRLEKHVSRYLKLQKVYPLPLISKPLSSFNISDNGLNQTINLLQDFLSEIDSIIFTGFYVYNYYLQYTKYSRKDNRFKQIAMPYLEVYSTNYIEDGLNIIKYLDGLDKSISSKISRKEFYPFFQFYGYNCVFYFDTPDGQIPILYLYSNNKKCIPFKQVSYVKFDNIKNNYKITPKQINIGSFDFNILHALIILAKIRVDDDDAWKDIIYTLINSYVGFRKQYFESTNINLYDSSIFEGFVVDCKGKFVSPDKERRELIQQRKKQGKPLVYRYEPGSSRTLNLSNTNTSNVQKKWNFANSSGNEILNNSLKLIRENLTREENESTEITESTELSGEKI
jgi:hypothetical protein